VAFTHDEPTIFTHTAPLVFTNDVPVIFSQDVPLSDKAIIDYPSGKIKTARRNHVRKKAKPYGYPRNDPAHSRGTE
jgi:hypothetical protein